MFWQMLFRLSPLRTQGVGLSGGEMMEHLWSFLRRLVRMTKEMSPAHRIDVLTIVPFFTMQCALKTNYVFISVASLSFIAR